MQGHPGSEYFTGDSVIGASGQPVRIYSTTHLSDGTGRDLVIRDGTDATGNIWIQRDGDANKSVTTNWENGILFPNGAFLDIGDLPSVVICYEVEA